MGGRIRSLWTQPAAYEDTNLALVRQLIFGRRPMMGHSAMVMACLS